MKNKKLTNEEKVLQILINKCKNPDTKTNRMYVYKTDFDSLNITENDVVKSLFILNTDNAINIIKSPAQNDLSFAWIVELTSIGIHYFENKEEKEKENQTNWTQYIITTIIAAITAIIAVIALE